MARLHQRATEKQGAAPDCAALVLRVLEGETEAFRPLVEAFEPAVHGLCRRLLFGNSADAEDLTQETFVRAFRYLPTLQDRARFAPWLYQIARSLCRLRRRRYEVERRALASRAEELRLAESARMRQDPLADTVSDALSELPAEERDVLHLRYFEGLSYEELGKRLGVTPAQVDHRIRRARSRLARRMDARRSRERAL